MKIKHCCRRTYDYRNQCYQRILPVKCKKLRRILLNSCRCFWICCFIPPFFFVRVFSHSSLQKLPLLSASLPYLFLTFWRCFHKCIHNVLMYYEVPYSTSNTIKCLYPSVILLSKTRSFALLDRLFSSSSSLPGTIGFLVITFPFDTLPHTQTGNSGGQIQWPLHWLRKNILYDSVF
mgnify:CR=1 FL=1